MSVTELATGWKHVLFGDVVRNVNENTRDPEGDGIERVVGLEHLDSDSLPLRRWNELADLLDGTSFSRKFQAGQVLFGKRRAYQRKVAVPDFDGICSGDILVFQPSSEMLLPEFLPYVVQSDGFFDHALGTSAGSLSPRTKWQDLSKYEFTLPPIDEQRRIVEVLNAADAAVEGYEQAGSRAALALRAVRHDLLNADYRSGTRRLKDVVSIAAGRVYPSPEYCTSGIRLLRPGNIASGGRLSWDSYVCLADRWSNEPGSVRVSPGDVVMNLTAQSLEDGFLGRVCLATAEDEAIVNQRIACIRSDLLIPAYLCAVFQHSGFRRHVASSAKGSKIKHLYERDLLVFEVPTPPRDHQEKVVNELNHILDAVDGCHNASQRASQVRSALMRNLLGAADVH